jgi:hypothetical protein
MITLAFRSSIKRTIILPMPDAPPVIKMVLDYRLFMGFIVVFIAV